jgi:hypothetical protein
MLGKNNKKIYLIYIILWFLIINIYCKFIYKDSIIKNIYLDTKIDTLKIIKYSNERNLCIFNDTIFYFKNKNKNPITINYFKNKFNDSIDLQNINIPYKIFKNKDSDTLFLIKNEVFYSLLDK